MKKTIKGRNYEFFEMFKDHIATYCEIGGKWTELTRTFKNWDEVEEWCKEMEKEKVDTTDYSVRNGGYDSQTKYFGD